MSSWNLLSLSVGRKPAAVVPAPVVAAPALPAPARTHVTSTDPSVQAIQSACLEAGTLSRPRNCGVHLDVQRLDVPAAGQVFMLAPPHARGAYGCVSYCLGPHKARYAAKSVYTAASVEQAWSGVSVMSAKGARREIGIAQHVSDAVGSVSAVNTDDKLIHVMQLMDGSWFNLAHAPAADDITLGAEGFLRSARSLASFHQTGVLHGDLKLENLLWNRRGMIKWGDYGVSEAIPPRYDLYGRRGTEFAMAPEVSCDRCFNLPADMWSFGVVLSEMFVGINDSPFRLGYDFLSVDQVQRDVVDEEGKLNVSRLLAGPTDLHRYFARWYKKCPTACRFGLEELFVFDPDHRASASRAVNVAKKLVRGMPGHATAAKSVMAGLPVESCKRERTFSLLEEAWRHAVG